MGITVNLWSKKHGEIKRFLEKYYDREVSMEEDAGRWLFVYRNPLESVDMISAVMDNNDKYELRMYLQVNEGEFHPVTCENHNEIIKDIFQLFYSEAGEITC